MGIVKIAAFFPALVHSYYCIYINYAGSVSTLELEHVFDKGHGMAQKTINVVSNVCRKCMIVCMRVCVCTHLVKRKISGMCMYVHARLLIP